ncbi:MAG: hypothetical protein AAGA23_07025 [Pseudomonadota bacterium]
MTERSLSDAAGQLSRLIADRMDDAERAALEQAVLADDQVFDELLAAEAELLDELAEGTLTGEQAKRVSRMLSHSAGLRQRAQLALDVKQMARRDGGTPASRSTPRWHGSLGWAVALGLLAALLWQSWQLRQMNQRFSQERTILEQQLDALGAAIERQEQRLLDVEQQRVRERLTGDEASED